MSSVLKAHLPRESQNLYTHPKLSLHTGACMCLSQFLLREKLITQDLTSAKPEQI